MSAPDYELRKVVHAALKEHKRAKWFPGESDRIGCTCGWESNSPHISRYSRFLRHQAWAVEVAVSKWMEETFEEVA